MGENNLLNFAFIYAHILGFFFSSNPMSLLELMFLTNPENIFGRNIYS